jgi:hypothetical protein
MNLGFEGLLAANVHFDLLGLGFGLLGKVNFQHALVIVGAHLPGIDGTRQRERPGELSVLPLDATEVLLFLFLLDLALAMDGEGVVLDMDSNVLLVDPRTSSFRVMLCSSS